jgi:heat shock protein HslJ
MKNLPFLSLLLLLFFSVSCTQNKKSVSVKPAPNLLSSETWVLESWFTNDSLRTMHTMESIQLSFDDSTKRINGNDGCNNFIASYAYDESRLTVKMGGGTKKYCGEESAKDEQYFQQFIQSKPSYLVRDGILILESSSDKLKFNPQKMR